MDYVQLDNLQVALVAALIVVNGAISVGLKLRLGKTLVLATVRTVVQLTLVGRRNSGRAAVAFAVGRSFGAAARRTDGRDGWRDGTGGRNADPNLG